MRAVQQPSTRTESPVPGLRHPHSSQMFRGNLLQLQVGSDNRCHNIQRKALGGLQIHISALRGPVVSNQSKYSMDIHQGKGGFSAQHQFCSYQCCAPGLPDPPVVLLGWLWSTRGHTGVRRMWRWGAPRGMSGAGECLHALG